MLTRRFGYVEDQLAHSPYLMGNHFTVADAYMFVVLRWSAPVGFDLTPFPRIREYMEQNLHPAGCPGGNEGRRFDPVSRPFAVPLRQTQRERT